MSKPLALIVDDEPDIRELLEITLARMNIDTRSADCLEAAYKLLEKEHFQLCLTDMHLPDGNGISLVQSIQQDYPQLPVAVITAYGSMETAVASLKAGAFDFVSKPVELARLRDLVNTALKLSPEATAMPLEDSRLLGQSPAVRELKDKIQKLARSQAPVYISGESGTGKELVARALHEQSPRHDAPMISVNCAAIPETLIESELFGYEKGSFTGAQAMRKGLVEAADGGTLFLDEIGELPLEAQARLLRLLQEKEVRRIGATVARKVDVRLVAATHRDLKLLASQQRFREDLYYRLNVVELKLPPLRERGEDIIELAQKLLVKICQRLNVRNLYYATDTLDAMRGYNWPGNVRELENAIERAVILCDTEEITPELLAIDYQHDPSRPATLKTGSGAPAGANEPPEGLSLEDYFQHFVLEHQDHMSETELAQKLGISRKSLWERRQRLGIPRRKAGSAESAEDE